MTTVTREWNGTIMEFRNEPKRAELLIDGKTVDFIEGKKLKPGVNDVLKGKNSNGDEICLIIEQSGFLGTKLKIHFCYNGRRVHTAEIGGFFTVLIKGEP